MVLFGERSGHVFKREKTRILREGGRGQSHRGMLLSILSKESLTIQIDTLKMSSKIP